VGTGGLEGNLAFVAVTLLGNGIPITPPLQGSGHPAWNQVGTTVTVNSDYEQALFWHEIGSSELGTPQFIFTFGSSARASCGGLLYTQTCLESGTPCADPILDSSVGMSTNSVSVSQSGNSSPGNAPGGQLNVPALGRVVGAFGTSDTNSFFGGGAPDGAQIGGSLGVLAQHTQSSGVNGGIVMADKPFSADGVAGPFPAFLPNRVDPPALTVGNIVGNGSIAIGTTNGGDIRQYGQTTLTATISGNSAFNGTFTITPTSATTFTFANSTNTTGTGGMVQPQDPTAGDNVSQVVSIKPVIP
jgi:hypothetical protein